MAVHSFGSILAYQLTSTSLWVELTEIKDMQLAGPQRSMADASYLNMASVRRIKKPGLVEGNEFSFNAHLRSGLLLVLESTLQLRDHCSDPPYFRVTPPCLGEPFYFYGWVSKIGVTIPEDDVIMVPVTIQLSEYWILG